MSQEKPISSFLESNFLHFNAASLVDAAFGYKKLLDQGGKMMITLAGAMSTAELGKSLAHMIREDKVHIICCTGANLEEDIFNLVAHDHYQRVPNYRDLTPDDEKSLLDAQLNRVTDTCIPEEEAMRHIEHHITSLWQKAADLNKRYFPHEYIFQLLESGLLNSNYQIDPSNSWVLAACEKQIPLVVPGWEDSTLGNIFAAHCIKKEFPPQIVKSGIEYMIWLAEWYGSVAPGAGVGFFQIGGESPGIFQSV